jgi:hypothetical protein
MALLALDIQPAPPPAPQKSGRPLPLRVRFDNVGRGLFPGRGLAGSFVLHVIGIALLLFLPGRLAALFPQPPPHTDEIADLETPTVIYLPRLGGGSEGNGRQGGGPAVHRQGSDVEPAQGKRGVSYPGPQAVVSNPPNATNHIQTILQPALKNPKVLTPLIPVPNIVQTTNAGPLPALDRAQPLRPPPSMQMQTPVAHAPVKTPDLATPIVPAPLVVPQDLPQLAVSAGPVRPALPMAMNAPVATARPNSQKEVAPPTQYSPVPTTGTDLQNLVALSPVPAPPQAAVQLPAGETRGKFAISPDSALTPGSADPGSKNATNPNAAFGTGNDANATAGNAASEGAKGNSKSGLPVGGKDGEGTSVAEGVGNGNGGAGTGTGRGSAANGGLGTGPGGSTGSGSSAGAGHGTGQFPGITIQGGGESGAAISAASHNVITVAQPRSYGMTVVSTASSGGGLADFGVFAHEPVYTVYLDMRKTPDDPAPSWVLQYAVLKTNAADPSQPDPAAAGGLIPPFPTNKAPLNLPPDLIQKYTSRQIVVYAILDAEGKIQNLTVKQSPDEQFNKPVLDALSKWTFRPAEVAGSPVAVKVLLGIPLT